MPVRLEDAAEIVSATRIVDVAEIESASVNKGDEWASKVDADQLRSIKMTLSEWGQIDDWTLDSDLSTKCFDSCPFVTRHFCSGHCNTSCC
jgi:hypothetical protein